MKYIFLVVIFTFELSTPILAQSNFKSNLRMGIAIGYGNENPSIIDNRSYTYAVLLHKLQFYYSIKDSSWGFDILVQPEFNIAHHQLLNRYFIDPSSRTKNDLDKKKKINEYFINLGGIIRKRIAKGFSTYLLLSVGPGSINRKTSRQAKGLLFSDNIFLGTTLGLSPKIFFDLRYGIRHISNANTHYPNGGHNSLLTEAGLSYKL